MRQIKKTIKKAISKAVTYYQIMLEWIFPRRCPVCDAIIARKEFLICETCNGKIQPIPEPKCMKCGKAIKEETKEYCCDCERKHHQFAKGRALFSYESISASLYRFKYSGRAEYADFYAKEIVECLGDEIKSWNADAIVPVPLHKSRYYKRGYNQAEILALKIGMGLQIPVRCKMIKRIRKTIPQKQLNPLEREKNLKKAFKIYENDVKLKTIIIVDDIFTTGSTIDAMITELRKAHIDKVYFITLAIGNGL